MMPKMNGLQMIEVMRQQKIKSKVIAVSGGGRIEPQDYLESACDLGVSATLAKPFLAEEILTLIDEIL